MSTAWIVVTGLLGWFCFAMLTVWALFPPATRYLRDEHENGDDMHGIVVPMRKRETFDVQE